MSARHSHGLSHSAEYRIFQGMHQRCENPRNPGYKDYGARGIYVDPRWRIFPPFYADVGPRPSPQHSLDRYPDPDGPYSPENTRWATHVQQHRNNRRNHLLTINGETHCLSEWEEITGTSAKMLSWRIHNGKSPDTYLTPKQGKACGSRNNKSKLTEETAIALYALKDTMTQRAAARLFGIHQTIVGDVWRKDTWKHIHT